MTVRIDFHLHTIAVENKDTAFNFSMDWLNNYIDIAGLDAIAITNHNVFSGEQFEKIQKEIEGNCEVFPGMELSLKDGHVNLVFDNTKENIKVLCQISRELNLGTHEGLTFKKFKQLFLNLRKGLIIFETGKSKSLDIDEDFNDPFFKNFTFVRGVNSQLNFNRALMQKEQSTPVLFSDGHATDEDFDKKRNDIQDLMLKNTFVQMEKFDFQQLLIELKTSKHVKSTNSGFPDVFQINVHGQTVTASTNLNLVIGRRGSGKTYLLNHIRNQYGKDNSVDYIRQFESTDTTRNFLTQETEKIAQKEREKWVQKNEIELNSIVDFYKEPFEDEIAAYLESAKRFAYEVNRSKTASQVKIFSEDEFEIISVKAYKKTLLKLKDVIETSGFWKLPSQDTRAHYVPTFRLAYKEIQNKLKAKDKENRIKESVNEIMEDVKQIISKFTSISSLKPVNFYNQFIHSKEKEYILKYMKTAINEKIDRSDPKYSFQIHISKKKWSSADEFLNNGIPKKGQFSVKEKLIIPYQKKDYLTFLENIFSRDYQEHLTLENGADLSRYLFYFKVDLLTKSGFKVSGGQEVAIGLMMKLDDARKKDIILVDEPEASLDNIFIKQDLIPKLREISENTPVFVITHNSTLGALLNPDRLIIAKYDPTTNEHNILTGDFHARIISDDVGNTISSYDDFVDAMEAGIDTYEEKGEQYESLRN